MTAGTTPPFGIEEIHIAMIDEETVRPQTFVIITVLAQGQTYTIWNAVVRRGMLEVARIVPLILSALTDRGPMDAFVVAHRFFTGRGLAS